MHGRGRCVTTSPPCCLLLVLCETLQVGEQRFYTDLFMVGLLYHLYNQVGQTAGGTLLSLSMHC